ncbi:hypothetical protein TNCV_3354451 [Trichonephila clavipes]|nr:hypothetical protein TNCV_3354451 [Trichonephila clavipes]
MQTYCNTSIKCEDVKHIVAILRNLRWQHKSTVDKNLVGEDIFFHQQVKSVDFQLCCDCDPVKDSMGNLIPKYQRISLSNAFSLGAWNPADRCLLQQSSSSYSQFVRDLMIVQDKKESISHVLRNIYRQSQLDVNKRYPAESIFPRHP